MKKSIIRAIFWGLVTSVLILIAIPTITIKLGNDYYRIQGLNPKDVTTDTVQPDFKFTSSLELQGGSIGTIDVDMNSVAANQKQALLDTTRDNLLIRLSTFQIFLKRQFKNLNYDLQEVVSTDNSQYQLLAKFPSVLTNDKLSIFTTPGQVSVWIYDPTNTSTDQTKNPYGPRKVTDITNQDIAAVNVVSDATCYFNDPAKPRNYCMRMTFNAAAQSKFNVAFVSTSGAQYPPLLFVDGAPVAIKSQGQNLSATNPGLTIDWYPVVDDDFETTAILTSIFNNHPLQNNVSVTTFNDLEATAGVNTITNIKWALVSAFIVVNVLLVVYFRKRGWFAVGMNILWAVYTLAIMQIFGLVLDLALIAGALGAFLLFLGFISYILYQIRTASKGGLHEDELESIYEHSRKSYLQITLLTCIMALVISIWAPAFLISGFIGFGFGVILGLIVMMFPGMELLKLIFLKSSKWKIW